LSREAGCAISRSAAVRVHSERHAARRERERHRLVEAARPVPAIAIREERTSMSCSAAHVANAPGRA